MLQKLQPQTKVNVEGEQYIVQLYSPSVGLTLYAKLVRLLGEPLLKLVSKIDFSKIKDVKTLDDISAIDLDGVGDAIGVLFSKLKDDEFVPLLQEILSSTFTKEMRPVNEDFEVTFAGHYNHVFKLVAKTLGAQYPNFLSGIVKRSTAAKSASVSPEAEKATG